MAATTARTIPSWPATALAQKIAGRRDVTVVIDADPDALILDVDTFTGAISIGAIAGQLSSDDALCRIDSLAQRLEYPVFAGLVLDGASRAAHSRWRASIDDAADPEIVAVAWTLDAARAHRRLIARSSAARLFLRASTPILFRGTEVGVRRAAEDLLPRVDAGILPRWAGSQLRAGVEAEIGADVVTTLEGIWREILDLKDSDGERLLALAGEWVQLWRDLESGSGQPGDAETTGNEGDVDASSGPPDATGASSSMGEPAEGNDTSSTAGEPGTGPDAAAEDGEGAPTEGHPSDDIERDSTGSEAEVNAPSRAAEPGTSIGVGFSDLVDNLLDAAEAEADTAVTAEQHRATGRAPSPEERENTAQRALATEIANKVFSRASTRRLTHRSPTTHDVAQRAAIVRRLQRAQYAAPRIITEHVGYPAGRPRTGALVQRAAQRAQRQVVTATPWRRNRRRVAEKPPIHAGIVVDHSGSMSAWLPAAGTAMWSLAAAVDELGGTTAAAGFGGAVTALMNPNTRPTLVPAVPDGGSSSGCAEAMAAVSDAAQLTVPFGARVLLVLTDGQLPGQDTAAINAHARYLHRHGVTVVWAITGSVDDAYVIPEHAVVVDNVTPRRVRGARCRHPRRRPRSRAQQSEVAAVPLCNTGPRRRRK
ncbi:vWA domain-containing protein [Prescottella equi]